MDSPHSRPRNLNGDHGPSIRNAGNPSWAEHREGGGVTTAEHGTHKGRARRAAITPNEGRVSGRSTSREPEGRANTPMRNWRSDTGSHDDWQDATSSREGRRTCPKYAIQVCNSTSLANNRRRTKGMPTTATQGQGNMGIFDTRYRLSTSASR